MRDCWNGPSCRYLARGECHFYHPPQHGHRRSESSICNFDSIFSLINLMRQRQKKEKLRLEREQREKQKKQRQRRQRERLETENFAIQRILIANRTTSAFSNSSSNEFATQRERTVQNLFGVRRLQREVPTSSTSLRQSIYSRLFNRRTEPKQEEDQPQLEENIKWFFQKNVNLKYDESMKQKFEQCSICCSEYQKDQKIFVLFCHHNFHKDCIKKWFTMNTVCPFCRKDFRKHEQYSQYDKAYMSKIQKPKTSSLFQSIPFFRTRVLGSRWDDQDV